MPILCGNGPNTWVFRSVSTSGASCVRRRSTIGGWKRTRGRGCADRGQEKRGKETAFTDRSLPVQETAVLREQNSQINLIWLSRFLYSRVSPLATLFLRCRTRAPTV